ncbi:MAG TPA: VOC family protein, partial [Acidimicrobiia bacterium]|nr:VOC family protein [Acidimicrobiia bacterium]
LAGIMDASGFLPEGVPSYWTVYFEVESADATLQEIERLGGAMPDMWSVYLATDDAARVVKETQAHGGGVIVEAMDVMDLGVMAVLTDPSGAAIGAWKPGEHKGFGIYGEANAPAWFELHTREYDKAVQFYKDVFSWPAHTAVDEPDFKYTTYGEGETALAGIMDASGFLPEGVPSYWTVYFEVESADATLQDIERLGGTTVTAPEDTPYGRLATASDPTGASFRLMS